MLIPSPRKTALCAISLLLASAGYSFSKQQAVDLTGVANRSFIDAVAGDGRGGWTDQGPHNSLPGIRPGKLSYGGINFEVIDASANNGQSVLVFPIIKSEQAAATDWIALSDPEQAGSMYLLHTGAWIGEGSKEIGTVSVRYASGKEDSFPVTNRSEISDWWRPTDRPNGIVAYREHNGSANVGLYMSRFTLADGEGAPVAVRFASNSNAIWLVVAATLSSENIPLQQPQEWTAVADEEWLPFDQSDSAVRPGTALDLSTVFPPMTVGEDGFMIINEQGEFAFENKPDEPLRLMMYSATMTRIPRTPELIEAYAEQIARAGYNVYRPHFLDIMLMSGSNEDGVFNPRQLDRWDLLSAELKKRGVYLYIDAMTSWTHFYAVENPWGKRAEIPDDKGLTKTRLYYDPAARKDWEDGVRKLFEHVNPYTGIALKDEPQVIAVQLRNEAGLSFVFGRPDDPGLVEPFRKWLKERYGNTAALRSAWTQQEGDARVGYLRTSQTIDNVGFPQLYGSGPDTRDLWQFFIDIEKETWEWLAQTIRQIGVKVPLTDFNCTTSIQSTVTRSVIDFVDNHTYHDHPSGFDSKGSAIGATSSIHEGLGYFHGLAATRQWGKPFMCSEWGNVFWNPYRYEAGLTFPAYAALQDWQVIAHFTDPVGVGGSHALDYVNPVRPFDIWRDPALKPAEYMTAFLYRRGDVATALSKTEVRINPEALGEATLWQGVSPSLSSVALLTGLGTRLDDGVQDDTIDVVFDSFDGANLITGDAAQVVASDGTTAAISEYVSQLRSSGVLSESNLTDPAAGIYQSDTGELLLNRRSGQMTISTPRSQGATLTPKAARAELGELSVENVGEAGLAVMAASLTDAPLQQSDHMLLLISTDGLNTDMRFADDTRRQLVSNGKAPALIRRARLNLTLRNDHAADLRLWALAPNGERREEIPLVINADSVSAMIDTGALANGATPYFEIVAAP